MRRPASEGRSTSAGSSSKENACGRPPCPISSQMRSINDCGRFNSTAAPYSSCSSASIRSTRAVTEDELSGSMGDRSFKDVRVYQLDESVDESGILPPAPGLDRELRAGLACRPSPLVRPIRGHRVESVDDAHDLRFERDAIA